MKLQQLKLKFLSLILSLIISPQLFAQLIAIKTVPFPSGNQFLFLPSQNLGMANVSIALDDPKLDPFINPAKGIRLNGTHLFSAPASFSISNGLGRGRVLPMSIYYRNKNHFGGLLFASQELQPARRNGYHLLNDRKLGNYYTMGMFGKKVNSKNLSIGVRLFWAKLKAAEGVDLLYWRSRDIKQSGDMVDLRIGLFSEIKNNREYEVILLYNRFNMTHDVSYQDSETAMELENLDRSRTVGIHLGHVRPISNSYWRIGGIITANIKTHPKIPNYEIMNIQRDPGRSFAANIGVGLSRNYKGGIIALDFIYEPIWTNTWADAIDDITTPTGQIIYKGDKTVENHFRFINWIARIGFSGMDKHLGFQMGLQFHSIGYDLNQKNYEIEVTRKQHERWLEWSAHWGIVLIINRIEFHYQLQMTSVSLLRNLNNLNVTSESVSSASIDYIPAPNRPIQFPDTKAIVHQITISIPIS